MFMKMRVFFLSVMISLVRTPVHAEQRSLWEIGAGAGAINLPDYPGSDVRKTFLLPIPYVIYRGEYFRVDRDGLRSLFFESDRVELNLSLSLALGGKSNDNPIRRGMADLKPTAEAGPTVDLTLWQSPNEKIKLDFRIPVRAAITVESSPKPVGWLFSPNLQLALRDPAGWQGWRIALEAGPVFNNRRYNAHFYSVAAGEATAMRPAYAAPGGYAGSQIGLRASKRFARYWLGGFLRYDTLKGAVFQDSPLVRRQSAVTAGIGFAWVFSESSIMVADTE